MTRCAAAGVGFWTAFRAALAAGTLFAAFLITTPVDTWMIGKWMIGRGKDHAMVHQYHH